MGLGLRALTRRLDPNSSSGQGFHECLWSVVSGGKFGLGQDKIVTVVVFVRGRGGFLMPLVHSLGILLVGSVLLSQKCRSFSPFPQKTTDSFVRDRKVEVWRIFVFVNQVQTSSFGRRERARTVHVKTRKLQATV